MKYRIKFSKLNNGRYISHLDLLRCFTRAISRAGLPVKYSEGFNPHMALSLVLPLPVGVTSTSEYLDITMTHHIPPFRIVDSLNSNLPPDIRMQTAAFPIKGAKDISYVEYLLTFAEDGKYAEDIEAFLSKDEHMIIKRSKRREKSVNMMELITGHKLMHTSKDCIILKLYLYAESDRSIKPNIVAEEICRELTFESIPDIMRAGIYFANGDEFK